MPNWKKVIVSGSDAILNQVTASGGILTSQDIMPDADNTLSLGSSTQRFQLNGGTPVTVDGSGTANTLTRFQSATTVEDSSIFSSDTLTRISHDNDGNDIFIISGSNGELLKVTDTIGDTLFQVNDGSGITQFEVSSSGLTTTGDVEIDDWGSVSASLASLDASTYNDSDVTSHIGTLGVLSSSLQIASEISGAFDSVSASIASDIDGLDNYVEWHLAGEADTTDVTSQKFVKFTGGQSITGAGTEGDPYVMTIVPNSLGNTTTIDSTSDAQIILDRNANSNDAEIVFKTNGSENWSIGTGQIGGDASFTIRGQGSANYFVLDTNGDLSITNSGSFGHLSVDNEVSSSDVNINNWGSVSASLASIDSGANNLTLQDVTDNGTTTTDGITVGGISVTGMTTGVDNSVVILDSDNTLKTDEIDSRVWGSTLVDASNGSNNRLATFTDSNSLNGEANLQFDGSTFTVTGNTYTTDFTASNKDIKVGLISIGAPSDQNGNAESGGTILGREALQNNTFGTSNTALGAFTLRNNGVGNSNTAVGHDALENNESGSHNVAVGNQSLNDIVSGDSNTAIGSGALKFLISNYGSGVTDDRNTAIGREAFTALLGGVDNIALGYLAGGNALTNASGSIYIGSQVVSAMTAYDTTPFEASGNEIVIGTLAIGNGSNTVTIGNSSITNNYFSGDISGSDITIDDWGSVSASLADLNSSIDGVDSSVTLQDATDNGSTTTNEISTPNILINSSSANHIIRYGYQAASTAVEDTNGGVIIGQLALSSSNNSVSNTVIIGPQAMYNYTGPSTGNTVVGAQAASYLKTGLNNTILGEGAMNASQVTSSNHNTAIGHGSLKITRGDYNVALGSSAGYQQTNGSGSIYIGRGSGKVTDGGSHGQHNSIYLGNFTSPFNTTTPGGTSNEVVIGTSAQGNGTNTVTIGNSSITANYFSGDISGSDVTIDDWGSVSASLSDLNDSIAGVDSSVTLQDATDNGNTTTNSITVAGLTSTDKVILGSAVNDKHEVTGSIFVNTAAADLRIDAGGFEVACTGSVANAGFLISGSSGVLNASEGDILIAGYGAIHTPWSDRGSYNKLVQSGSQPDSLLQMDTRYYIGAVVHYTAYSSDYSNIRTGTISLAFNSTTFTLNETSTTDVGDTDSLTFSAYFIGTPASLYLEANFSNDWNISLDYTFLRKAEFKNSLLNYTIQNQ